MTPVVCRELLADRREWREMADHLATTATQAVQLWLAEDERELGGPEPGVTISAYAPPLHTWASMPQLIGAERWPGRRPPPVDRLLLRRAGGGVALRRSGGRVRRDPPAAGPRERRRARRGRLAHLLPGTTAGGSSRWDLLCGRDGHSGADAIDTQLHVAGIDPSDRDVQCAPGTDAYRLRPDESGYDNLVLAGDWTDDGLNAGCIEAATLSGLQAANAALGRSRGHRIAGVWMS